MCKILILFIYFFTNSHNSHHLRAERTQPILVSRQHSGDVREISVCRHQNFDKSATTSLSSGKILTPVVFVAVLVGGYCVEQPNRRHHYRPVRAGQRIEKTDRSRFRRSDKCPRAWRDRHRQRACRPCHPRGIGAQRQAGIGELRSHTIGTSGIGNFRS